MKPKHMFVVAAVALILCSTMVPGDAETQAPRVQGVYAKLDLAPGQAEEIAAVQNATQEKITALRQAEAAVIASVLNDAQIAQVERECAAEREAQALAQARHHAEIAERDMKIDEQAAKIVALENINAQYATEVAHLSAAMRQHAQINETLQRQIMERRDHDLKLQTRVVELNERVHDLEATITQRDAEIRRLRDPVQRLENQGR